MPGNTGAIRTGRVLVELFAAASEPVPGLMDLPEGWYALPVDGEE